MTQATTLVIPAAAIAKLRGRLAGDEAALVAFAGAAGVLQRTLDGADMAAVARRYVNSRLHVRRSRPGYPVALEGALKLKEVSYVHAEGWPPAS